MIFKKHAYKNSSRARKYLLQNILIGVASDSGIIGERMRAGWITGIAALELFVSVWQSIWVQMLQMTTAIYNGNDNDK